MTKESKFKQKIKDDSIINFSNFNKNEYYDYKDDYNINTADQRLKSPEVGYMELKESNFTCGECYFIKENGYCANKSIKCNVNITKGCCNLYIPKRKDEVDSSNWIVNKKY